VLRELAAAECDRLDCSRHDIGDAGMGALALLLSHVSGAFGRVRKLLLDKCAIGAMGTIALSDALAAGALSGLEQLSLAGNTIRDAGVGALADERCCSH